MSKRPSSRGWEILQQLVNERAKAAGHDADLAPDEKSEALQAAADGARKLLRDPSYQRIRLEGLEEVVESFVAWVQLDPAGPHYERELIGLHMRASPRYWSLFRPEEIISEAAAVSKKQRDSKEGK